MTQDSKELIREQVQTTKQRLEDTDVDELESPVREIEALDVKADVNMRGDVGEIVLVLGTGGPHIEYNVSSGHVEGWWGGESHREPVRNEALNTALYEAYKRHYSEVVLA